MLTVTQSAARLSVTPGRIRQFIREGRLKAERLGPRMFAIREKDLQEFGAVARPHGQHTKK